MKYVEAFLVLTLSFVLFACAPQYVSEKPSPSDFEGEYELHEFSMDSYVGPEIYKKLDSLHPRPTINILADGRFLATNFPLFSEIREEFEYRFEGFRNIQTTWKQDIIGYNTVLGGKMVAMYGLRLADLPSPLNSPIFTGKKTVNGLFIGFGDPDSRDWVSFRKKMPSK